MRACIISAVTGVCVNIIELDALDPSQLDVNLAFAPDSSGEIGLVWDGAAWRSAPNPLFDAALSGEPTAPTPSVDAEVGDQVATTFYVDQMIATVLATYFVSSGYDAGRFSGTGSNFTFDLDAGLFNGTGANFAYTIDGGTFV